jgi:hypothetical protein
MELVTVPVRFSARIISFLYYGLITISVHKSALCCVNVLVENVRDLPTRSFRFMKPPIHIKHVYVYNTSQNCSLVIYFHSVK